MDRRCACARGEGGSTPVLTPGTERERERKAAGLWLNGQEVHRSAQRNGTELGRCCKQVPRGEDDRCCTLSMREEAKEQTLWIRWMFAWNAAWNSADIPTVLAGMQLIR